MGAGNVKAVYASWPELPDRAFRLLVFMALTAKDEDQPPRFWGGQEGLAVGLGRTPPYSDNDYRAVDRAMKALRDAGAIVQTRHAAPLVTACHELVLTPAIASPDAERRVNEVLEKGDTRRSVTGEHPTQSGTDTRRSVAEHPTLGGGTPDATRRPEENEDPRGLTSGTTEQPPAYVEEGGRDISQTITELLGRHAGSVSEEVVRKAVAAVAAAKQPAHLPAFMRNFSAEDLRRWAGESTSPRPRRGLPAPRRCAHGELVAADGYCCETCADARVEAS